MDNRAGETQPLSYFMPQEIQLVEIKTILHTVGAQWAHSSNCAGLEPGWAKVEALKTLSSTECLPMLQEKLGRGPEVRRPHLFPPVCPHSRLHPPRVKLEAKKNGVRSRPTHCHTHTPKLSLLRGPPDQHRFSALNRLQQRQALGPTVPQLMSVEGLINIVYRKDQ